MTRARGAMRLDTVLKWYVRIWVGLLVAFNAFIILGSFVAAPEIHESPWAMLADWYSPLVIWNALAEIVFVAPPLAVHFWRRSRLRRLAAQ